MEFKVHAFDIVDPFIEDWLHDLLEDAIQEKLVYPGMFERFTLSNLFVLSDILSQYFVENILQTLEYILLQLSKGRLSYCVEIGINMYDSEMQRLD